VVSGQIGPLAVVSWKLKQDCFQSWFLRLEEDKLAVTPTTNSKPKIVLSKVASQLIVLDHGLRGPIVLVKLKLAPKFIQSVSPRQTMGPIALLWPDKLTTKVVSLLFVR